MSVSAQKRERKKKTLLFRVEVVRGKVKNTGEIHLSLQAEGGGVHDAATAAANGRDAAEDGGGVAGASKSGQQVAAAAAAAVGGKSF